MHALWKTPNELLANSILQSSEAIGSYNVKYFRNNAIQTQLWKRITGLKELGHSLTIGRTSRSRDEENSFRVM